MPTYEHLCQTCNHEWEDEYSIKAAPPANCPSCQANTVQRLISGGNGRGMVELTGNDLVEKLKSDGQKLKRDMHSSEKVYSNLLGESKYQDLQKRIDTQKRDRR